VLTPLPVLADLAVDTELEDAEPDEPEPEEAEPVEPGIPPPAERPALTDAADPPEAVAPEAADPEAADPEIVGRLAACAALPATSFPLLAVERSEPVAGLAPEITGPVTEPSDNA
jgi:nicotinate-nucleotide--dimethylbenzimidazole phosphoribosyltransferase